MRRGSKAVALAIACAFASSACTGSAKPQPTPQASGPALHRGGTLRVGIQQWNSAYPYDPAANFDFGANAIFSCCLLRTLYSYNGRSTAEGGTELRPDLASGPPEISTDGLTWTIHIKAGLHYAPPLQRTEIVAQDFIRAIERILSPAPKGSFGPSLGGDAPSFVPLIQGTQDYTAGKADSISGLEAFDAHTLRIHLTHPAGDLAYRFSLISTAPIPPDPFEPAAKFGVATGHEADGYGRFLVSSGPYMIEGSPDLDFSRPPDQQQPPSGLDPLVLVRNPSWRSSSDQLREAYPDRIEFSAYSNKPYTPQIGIGNSDAYRIAFTSKVESGALDLLLDWPSPTETVRRYQADPSLKHRVAVNDFPSIRFLSLNLALPPFDDVHVRRAVNYAVAKQPIITTFQALSTGRILDHLAPDASENNLLLNYHPYPAASGKANLSAAKGEMRLSAYDKDQDGRCDLQACSRVRVWWRNDGPFPRIAALVKRDLSRIGIDLDVAMVSADKMYQRCGDPAQHATLCQAGLVAGYPNPSTFFPSEFSSETLAGPGGVNFSLVGASPDQLRGWKFPVRSVPNVDERIATCDEALGSTQIQCWADLDQFLMEEVVPDVPLFVETISVIFSDRVASFSWGQVFTAPALQNIALRPGS